MPNWKFELTDAQYRPIGEVLNAADKQITLPLSKVDSLSFTVRVDNPLAGALTTTEGYIKAYRDGVLRFYGPIVSAEEVGESGSSSVAVTASGVGWRFQSRLVAKNGGSALPGGGDTYTAVDRAAIMTALINEMNLEDDTGIQVDGSNTAASTVTYVVGAYRKANEVLSELAAGFNGFDWRMLPVDNFNPLTGSVTGSKIGTFYVRPVIGGLPAEAIFEMGLGTRNNIASYKRTVTRDSQANQVYHLTTNALWATKDESISTFHLMEDVAQADITDITMRSNLVSDHIAARAYPRQILQFTPHIDPTNSGRVPRFGIDYDIGDSVQVRIVNDGVTRVSALVRIWGIQFAIDPNGVERSSYVLAEE